MPYVMRSQDGKISRVSVKQIIGSENLPHGHPEILDFLKAHGQDPARVEHALSELRRSDSDMSRAIEDVIMALLKKNVLRMTDLPKPLQDRMAERVRLRVMIQEVYDQASG